MAENDDKYVHSFEALSRFSEAGKEEEERLRRNPPKPVIKPGVQDFTNIPAAAFKEGSVFNETIANKFNPATDSIAETLAKGGKKKGGNLKNSGNKTPSNPVAKKDASPEEKERVALIKKHNKYARNQVIVNHLAKRGHQMFMLPSNASLEEAKAAMDDIDEALSAGACKSMVLAGMKGLNMATQNFVPVLAKQHPQDVGLDDAFFTSISNPDTEMALSMEELAIAIEPYAPVGGFISRFISSYSKMCLNLYTYKVKSDPVMARNPESSVTEDDVMPEDEE